MRPEAADTGQDMHRWISELFPVCRSLTGDGVRQTLAYLKGLLPAIEVHEIPSGTKVLDWTIPDEWNIQDAYVADLDGNRLIDFRENNLHIVGYSEPIDSVVSLQALDAHLFSLPAQPDAIPYVTSYYARNWGFCLTQRQRDTLGTGPFRVVIRSDLQPGYLTYADAILPGDTDDEVLLSTYVCHPSMANNELSGPAVTTALGRWLAALPGHRYTYRIVFLPETIGAIAYLSLHMEHLREKVKAGWVVTCVGDDRTFSYVPSRLGGTLSDRVSLQVLGEIEGGYDVYTYLDRGSDERQWCSPGAALPICSVMRSKYATYPEYHTSLDDLGLVTANGLQGGFDTLMRCIELLEMNYSWRATTPGEPQLGPRGLYPATSFRDNNERAARTMLDVLAYCDGDHDLVDLCRRTNVRTEEVAAIIDILARNGLIVRG